jgi:flagellar biogenesis protein FliO
MSNRCAFIMHCGPLGTRFLVVTALALAWMGQGAVALSAADTQPAAQTAPTTQEASTKPSGGGLWSLPHVGDANIPFRPDGNSAGPLAQMLAYVLVILALGAIVLIVIKRVVPKIGKVSGKNVTVIETIYLGPRQTVHLLRVGTSKILVAAAPNGVTMLADVTKSFPQEGHDKAVLPVQPEVKP